MRILLFGTMGDTGAQALAGLRIAGIEAELVDFPQNIFRDEAGYRRKLLSVLKTYGNNGCKPDAIMPVGHPLALSRMKKELAEAGIAALVEDERKIFTLDSKVAFSALAKDLGIPQPKIYGNAGEADFSHTIIFKRDKSFGGHGVHIPKNRTSLEHLIDHQPEGEPFLIEDYIEGTDCSTDAVRIKGIYKASSYRSLSISGRSGPSRSRELCRIPAIEEYARTVLDELDYEGVCGFDFKMDSRGNAFILEANPRFTAGIGDQINSGFNIPAMLAEGIIKKK